MTRTDFTHKKWSIGEVSLHHSLKLFNIKFKHNEQYVKLDFKFGNVLATKSTVSIYTISNWQWRNLSTCLGGSCPSKVCKMQKKSLRMNPQNFLYVWFPPPKGSIQGPSLAIGKLKPHHIPVYHLWNQIWAVALSN